MEFDILSGGKNVIYEYASGELSRLLAEAAILNNFQEYGGEEHRIGIVKDINFYQGFLGGQNKVRRYALVEGDGDGSLTIMSVPLVR